MIGSFIKDHRHPLICISILYLYFLYNGNIITTESKHLAAQPQKPDVPTKKSMRTDQRPHMVIAILSLDKDPERRNAVRATWVSSIQKMHHILPFRITYKFVLDNQTKSTLNEKTLYNDIIYINSTGYGYAKKFGEKLYLWYRYVQRNYPDADLVARIDDDAFLCIPEIIYRLSELRAPTLFYGWKVYQKKYNIHYIDEMLLVLGREIVDRITNREYCGKATCDTDTGLVELDWGSWSLANWLKPYKDIKLHGDNAKIVYFSRGRQLFINNKKFINGQFCRTHVAFHKALPSTMIALQREKLDYENTCLQRVSGIQSVFSGEIVRPNTTVPSFEKGNVIGKLNDVYNCSKWEVVTTIFSPSPAIQNIIGLSQWCIVIVADEKTPARNVFFSKLQISGKNRNVKYFSLQEQYNLYPLLSDTIPLNSFARKNLGYIFAIHNKAKLIWDFDDDNLGIIDKIYSPPSQMYYVKACVRNTSVVNPYTYFSDNRSDNWPRGFPLQSILDDKVKPQLCEINGNEKIGILQSLANHQPDVDAIYRLTKQIPFNFTATIKTHRRLIIPTGVFAPFNAQSTLWLVSSFKYLALPVSVNGRVSDIWRSYIAQYFLHRDQVHTVFTQPLVVQNRNEHNLIQDFNAELDLYEKSHQLISYLTKEKRLNINLCDLYYELYLRNYIGGKDLDFIDSWQITFNSVQKVIK